MKQSFDFQSHIEFLHFKLKKARWGLKGELANFLHVQPAFISQLLSEKNTLTLEQAEATTRFFDLPEEEAEFFLLLVSRDRAGTPALRKKYEKQMEAALAKRRSVAERLGKTSEIAQEAQGTYYSSWLYAAVDMACAIETLRTKEAIARKFRITPAEALKALHFLRSAGILRNEGEQYLPTQNWIRLEKGSPHLLSHHKNWRLKAIQNLERQSEQEVHYSGVFSLDEKTALKIQEMILKTIQEIVKEIEPAKNERLYAFCIDLFDPLKL